MDQKTNTVPFIIGGVLVLIAIALGAYAFMQKQAPGTDDMMHPEEEAMMEKDAMEGETMMETEDGMMEAGAYEAYAPQKLVRAETGDVVLFFHASWCPSCRGLHADIEKNKEAIPADLSILKVDYDTETELKKKYGVTYQHTLVQVSADGTLIKKWSGSPSLDSLVAEVN